MLTSVVNLSDTIPRELFDRARAVGVFPKLDRISFVLPNSRLAYGVICSRLAGGWSPPATTASGRRVEALTLAFSLDRREKMDEKSTPF